MPSFLGNNNALNSLDASNIWIGSDQSVTSLHKDHYENFVGGVMGVKTFSLYPPTDFGYIKYEKCIPCIHDPPSSNSTLWSIKRLEGTHVNWIVDVDPCIDPITVDIYPGDMLYLPSLWYHSVKMKSERFKDNNGQTACISINYWFDMDFGDRYCFMKYLARSLQEDN